ncbi:MAG TPA: Gfo/Idh/MocA family oxidoreductase [Caulobacteraceae bacterium]|nr:Gfo/Idh/MocA family oxidoreductase [Caulobacteraceae bacterium]
MSDELRAGVVGAGVFGGFHAKKYAELEGVRFIGVFDVDAPRAAELAAPLGGRAFADLESLLAEVDVVTIATPAVFHADAALAALKAGKPVYLEKPLAVTLEDADRIVAQAAARGLPVAVGHQERIVFQAMGLLDIPQKPLRLEAVRRGTPHQRNLDVSTVLDLMIHDLDLALMLTDADPIAVEAEGSPDETAAEVTFADGFTAVFAASRIAQARERTMKIVYPSGSLEIDFVARTFANTTGFALDEGFADTPAGRDPLGASVREFLDAVRGVSPRPLVTAQEAARALDLALAVEQAAGF